MRKIELFPQGGLGNQIIQHAYAAALCRASECAVEVNAVLLSRAWSRLRGNTWRPPSPLLEGYHCSVQSPLKKAAGLARLSVSLKLKRCITDSWDHKSIISLLSGSEHNTHLQLFGYFQRSHALSGGDSHDFWRFLATRLAITHEELNPYPLGQVVVHMRLGDYRLPANQKLFIQPSFPELLSTALEWRSLLGGRSPIHIVTDDAQELARHVSPTALTDLKFLGGVSAHEDFLILARHQHLVISNSTFSLCAGRLASELWGVPLTVAHPGRWFIDPAADDKYQDELNRCSFCTSSAHLVG